MGESMHRPAAVSGRRVVFASSAALAILLAALLPGCGGNVSRVVEPIPDPSPAQGAVVAGTVKLENGRAGSGVVVSMEPMANGITASVRRAMVAAKAGRAGIARAASPAEA